MAGGRHRIRAELIGGDEQDIRLLHSATFSWPALRSASAPLSDTSLAWWQAAKWLGSISTGTGGVVAHSSVAYRQRVRNRQPDGGLAGSGRSPCSSIGCRWAAGSGSGTADISASV